MSYTYTFMQDGIVVRTEHYDERIPVYNCDFSTGTGTVDIDSDTCLVRDDQGELPEACFLDDSPERAAQCMDIAASATCK